MNTEEFEAETIRRAKGGDAEAGREAIHLCISGLYSGQLSEPLRFYLADCLNDFIAGVPIERAMCLEIERARGRPADPFPEWEEPLAAVAALLFQRGYSPEAINSAMSEARAAEDLAIRGVSDRHAEGKGLERSQANRIRRIYRPMQRMSERLLLNLCTPAMRELMEHFPTQT
ncbi:MAG: hypothetical protein H6929_19965 [Rhodoferax sp.]|nr:hypothetical protein [Rhodoferax sp.]